MARNHAAVLHDGILHRRRHVTAEGAVRFLLDHFLLLPIGVAIALVWANVAAETYFRFALPLAFAVNEVGMALFIALITQEIIEALMPGGALHTWRRWGLVLVGAAGGVAGAAATFLGYVHSTDESVLAVGWPAACAIDIAAAYYTLKVILPRSGALPFALLLGITTDVLGALLVAPRFPTVAVHAGGAGLILAALGVAAVMRMARIRAFWPYLLFAGSLSWLAFYREGLHPAFALVPIVPFLPHEPRSLNLFADPPDDDVVHHFEHEWNEVVQVILFLFGLVNGGVVLRGYGTGTWAVMLAALVGRPLGIIVGVGLAVLAGLHLPRRIGARELIVTALALSTGFTFALFFVTGIVSIGPLLAQLTIGALATAAGSVLAFGAATLLRVGRFAHRA